MFYLSSVEAPWVVSGVLPSSSFEGAVPAAQVLVEVDVADDDDDDDDDADADDDDDVAPALDVALVPEVSVAVSVLESTFDEVAACVPTSASTSSVIVLCTTGSS